MNYVFRTQLSKSFRSMSSSSFTIPSILLFTQPSTVVSTPVAASDWSKKKKLVCSPHQHSPAPIGYTIPTLVDSFLMTSIAKLTFLRHPVGEGPQCTHFNRHCFTLKTKETYSLAQAQEETALSYTIHNPIDDDCVYAKTTNVLYW